MLWVNDANDLSFPLNVHKTTRATPRPVDDQPPRRDAPRPQARLVAAGNYVFADSVTKGGEPLARIGEEGRDRTHAWLRYRSGHAGEKAELVYTTEPKDGCRPSGRFNRRASMRDREACDRRAPPGTRGYFSTSSTTAT